MKNIDKTLVFALQHPNRALLFITNVIFCVGPQQFSVKEFYLKIIPWRLYTFRVCPGTKVSYPSGLSHAEQASTSG